MEEIKKNTIQVSNKLGELKIIFPFKVPSKKNCQKIRFLFTKKSNVFVKMRGVMRCVTLGVSASTEYAIWEKRAVFELKCASGIHNLKTPIKQPRIILEVYPETRRATDLSNKLESLMDAMVKAGFLIDDNWFECPEIHMHLRDIDKDYPRYVVTMIYK